MLATQQKIINQNQPIQPIQQTQPIQPNQQNVVNNFNIINPVSQNTIIVEHDKERHEFTFKNAQSQLIGTFNIYQLFKYINKNMDMFLIDVVIGSADVIISKYIYDNDKDKTKSYDLLSHTDSQFTGNIELLVKLYSDIIKIENELYEKMIDLPKDIIEVIKITNNKFIYNLLLRILKISNMLLDQPDIDKQKRDVLLRYSIGTVYKLSNMTREELEIKKLQYQSIQNDINKIIRIQSNIDSKLDLLKNTIDTQNINIDFIINEYTNKSDKKTQKKENDNLSDNLSDNTLTKTSNTITNAYDTPKSSKCLKKIQSDTSDIKSNIDTHDENYNDDNDDNDDNVYSISFKSIPTLSNLSNPFGIPDTSVNHKDLTIKSEQLISDKTKSVIRTYDAGSIILTSEKSTISE